MTDAGKELMRLLKEIDDDRDFVCGVMSNCGGEDAWDKMHDYITFARDQGERITSDDIVALSLSLGEKKDTHKGWFAAHKNMVAAL